MPFHKADVFLEKEPYPQDRITPSQGDSQGIFISALQVSAVIPARRLSKFEDTEAACILSSKHDRFTVSYDGLLKPEVTEKKKQFQVLDVK